MSKRAKAAMDLVTLVARPPDGTDGGGELGGGLGGEPGFHEGSALSSAEPLSMLAKRRPGMLFEMGVKRVREDLAALQGTHSDSTEMKRVMSFYHAVVFAPNHPNVGEHTAQEMRTLAEILDSLCEGNLSRVGDGAMQRYKALACATDDGSWALASEIEVVDPRQKSIVSEQERLVGTRRQLASVRLATSL